MKPIDIVFDIDGVLACHNASNVEEASFFLKKGAIIPAIKTHYIVPGVIELMKLLFQMEHITVSFFSAGVSERNEIFVKELLSLALGKDAYEQVSSKVRILSRNDMVRGERDPKNTYGLGYGEYKKDLSVFLKEADRLQNTILVEDDYSYVAEGQERNVIKLPMALDCHFSMLKRGKDEYDDEGRPLKFNPEVNAIFYLTGILFKSMEIAHSKQIPVSEVLFKMQYKPGEKEDTYEHLFYEIIHKEEMYVLGMEKLREINKDLTFVTPQNYLKCINSPLSNEEREFLTLAMKKEHSYL